MARQLAELKGAAGTIPNESILIDTLAPQEYKDSSEIENIVTTRRAGARRRARRTAPELVFGGGLCVAVAYLPAAA